MDEKEFEKIIREIYWAFRNAIHNEHMQIKIKDGKAIPNNPSLKDTYCYVCDVIHKIEEDVANVFGKQYYKVEKVEGLNWTTKGAGK